jgi:hypothetical protein
MSENSQTQTLKEQLAEKRNVCFSKIAEKEQKIFELQKKSPINKEPIDDLFVIKAFLKEHFDFDISSEYTKITAKATKIDNEISALKNEAHQIRLCFDKHYPETKYPNAALPCQNCNFVPFSMDNKPTSKQPLKPEVTEKANKGKIVTPATQNKQPWKEPSTLSKQPGVTVKDKQVSPS